MRRSRPPLPSRRSAGAALFGALLAAALAGPARAATVAERIARIDALHYRRDDGGAARELQQLVDEAVAQAPQDYGTLWRASRHYFWLADNPDMPKGWRSQMGKRGWDLAERAVALQPNAVEGHFFAAVNMGPYVMDVSPFKAVTQGLEGKFKAHITRAGELNPGYERGAIQTAWGRFWDEIPWPKRDAGRSEASYRRAMQIYPANMRARAWLADLWRHDRRYPNARQLALQVLGMAIGSADPPEDRRARRIAQRVLERLPQQAPPPRAPPPPPPPPVTPKGR
jgi:hypothetical protein